MYFVFSKPNGKLTIKRDGTAFGSNTDVTLDNISLKEAGQFSLDETTLNNNAKLFTGNALDFNGLNNIIEVSNHTAINFGDGDDFTIAFWINWSGQVSIGGAVKAQRIIDKRGDGSTTGKGYTLYIDVNNKLVLELNDIGQGSGNTISYILSEELISGIYQRIVVSADLSLIHI